MAKMAIVINMISESDRSFLPASSIFPVNRSPQLYIHSRARTPARNYAAMPPLPS
jgi:hypothetical protein